MFYKIQYGIVAVQMPSPKIITRHSLKNPLSFRQVGSEQDKLIEAIESNIYFILLSFFTIGSVYVFGTGLRG